MRVKAPFTGRAMLLWLMAVIVATVFALWDYAEEEERAPPDPSTVTDFEVLSPGSSR